MVNILFVCLGNICRSPLAEAVFTDLVNKNRANISFEVHCDSAGTASYHIGANPDDRSILVAKNHGVPMEHKGQKLSKEHFKQFQYIVAMDQSNLNHIMNMKSKYFDDVEDGPMCFLYRDFDPIEKGGDVPDPYYGHIEDFEEVFQIVHRTGERFLEYIRHKHN